LEPGFLSPDPLILEASHPNALTLPSFVAVAPVTTPFFIAVPAFAAPCFSFVQSFCFTLCEVFIAAVFVAVAPVELADLKLAPNFALFVFQVSG